MSLGDCVVQIYYFQDLSRYSFFRLFVLFVLEGLLTVSQSLEFVEDYYPVIRFLQQNLL